MNTEYAVGNLRIHFESRARRRWLVVLVYAILVVFDLVWIPVQGQAWFLAHAPWLAAGLLALIVVLAIIFSWLNDDLHRPGDERETHRREHAYARAYRPLGFFFLAALFAGTLFAGPHPLPYLGSPMVRSFLIQSPSVFLWAAGIVYIILPQAILLWTEPDMEPEAHS